jgi:hypothetical protein
MLVVSSLGDKSLHTDLNGDGKLERLALPRTGSADGKKKEADTKEEVKARYALPVSISAGAYNSLAATFFYVEYESKPASNAGAQPGSSAALAVSGSKSKPVPAVTRWLQVQLAIVPTATIKIDGKKTLFQYSLDLEKHTIDPLHGQLGVDCNGDGKIDGFPSNVEEGIANGEPLVFRVGTHYLATRSVNLATREVILESHPASDYTRIELMAGSEVPNFLFKDINGNTHQLSDYRGKYVLLDFWGTW